MKSMYSSMHVYLFLQVWMFICVCIVHMSIYVCMWVGYLQAFLYSVPQFTLYFMLLWIPLSSLLIGVDLLMHLLVYMYLHAVTNIHASCLHLTLAMSWELLCREEIGELNILWLILWILKFRVQRLNEKLVMIEDFLQSWK